MACKRSRVQIPSAPRPALIVHFMSTRGGRRPRRFISRTSPDLEAAAFTGLMKASIFDQEVFPCVAPGQKGGRRAFHLPVAPTLVNYRGRPPERTALGRGGPTWTGPAGSGAVAGLCARCGIIDVVCAEKRPPGRARPKRLKNSSGCAGPLSEPIPGCRATGNSAAAPTAASAAGQPGSPSLPPCSSQPNS